MAEPCIARRASRGLTRLEFVVGAALLAALAGLQLGAYLYYEELAEKTEVQLTILNVRTGLRYQVAERIMNGRTGELPVLTAVSPVSWLERPPRGYAGVLRTADAESLDRGTWYFDADLGELRYSPKLRNFLRSDSPWLRWRVATMMGAGGRGPVESLALVEVGSYSWFQE